MATPRKRFAAIETTLLREEWPDALKLTLVLLTLHMTERWAMERLTADQAKRCRLSQGDALNVTSCRSLKKARERLRQLSQVVTLELFFRGKMTEVVWEKLPSVQGWCEIDRRREASTTGKHSEQDARNKGAREPEQRPLSTLLFSSVREDSEEPSKTPAPDPPAPANAVAVPPAFSPPAAPSNGAEKKPTKLAKRAAPEAFSREEQAALSTWCEKAYPSMVSQLPIIAAKILDWGRGRGEIRADWVATVRNAVRSDAERRALAPADRPTYARRTH